MIQFSMQNKVPIFHHVQFQLSQSYPFWGEHVLNGGISLCCVQVHLFKRIFLNTPYSRRNRKRFKLYREAYLCIMKMVFNAMNCVLDRFYFFFDNRGNKDLFLVFPYSMLCISQSIYFWQIYFY